MTEESKKEMVKEKDSIEGKAIAMVNAVKSETKQLQSEQSHKTDELCHRMTGAWILGSLSLLAGVGLSKFNTRAQLYENRQRRRARLFLYRGKS